MATKKQPIGFKQSASQNKSQYTIVNQRLTIQSANLQKKAITDFRAAWRSAAQVHSPIRVRLYDLYDDVRHDGHLSGIVNKRRDAVLNKKIIFQDAAGKKVDLMDELLDSRRFRDLKTEVFDCCLWGCSLLEFVPGKLFNFIISPRKHIKPNLGVLAYEQSGTTGIVYEGVWNFWFVGDKADLGIYLDVMYYAIWKRGGLGDWAQFCELFGMPLRVVYYDANDTQTSTEIDKALAESGGAMVMKLPKESELKILDGKQVNGDGELQAKLMHAMNDEMSVRVLGNTQTTTSSKGSGYAQAKVHADGQLEITKSDMIDMMNWLNDPQFINILKSYGYPVDGGKFVFVKEYDHSAVSEQMDIAIKMQELGVPVADDDIYELTGFSKPEDYEQLKEQLATQRQALQKNPPPGDNNSDPENGHHRVLRRFSQQPRK